MINELIVFFVLCLLMELLYFLAARRFNIVDAPVERSSHNYVTFRGGGIVFPLGFMFAFLYSPYKPEPLFLVGLIIIALISFLDDIKNISSILRLVIQSICVVLLIASLHFVAPWYILLAVFIVVTGVINGYNFMDGINGITALYSLVTIGSLFWINQNVHAVMAPVFFEALIASLLVFSFFNLRKKAVCFAGDVGSISMAFLICYLLLRLAAETGSYNWFVFLSVYGIDTIFTICCRMFRREPLMKAHRSHFYQYLVNETRWTHIQVSVLYAGVQLVINLVAIKAFFDTTGWLSFACLLVIILIYLTFRFRLEGRTRLFRAY